MTFTYYEKSIGGVQYSTINRYSRVVGRELHRLVGELRGEVGEVALALEARAVGRRDLLLLELKEATRRRQRRQNTATERPQIVHPGIGNLWNSLEVFEREAGGRILSESNPPKHWLDHRL